MGKTFKNVVISVTGEFGPKADKFKQWTEANGGKYSKEVDNGVTHLLATQEAFKKANSAVRAAKRIKGIKIVSSDWLEDSLLSKSRCPKREGPYLWARTAKNAKKKAAKERASKGSKSSGQKKGPEDKPKQKQKKNQELDGHHIYSDPAGTRYMATLVRPIEESKIKEKHILKLYESDSTPHTYAVFAKYTRPGRVGSDFHVPQGSPLPTALKMFNKFFLSKTGKSWCKREGVPKPKSVKEGEALPCWEDWFEYVVEPSKAAAANTEA